ncbi:MAG: hypothetical protein ACOY31_04430 [Bacillota bacterium]
MAFTGKKKILFLWAVLVLLFVSGRAAPAQQENGGEATNVTASKQVVILVLDGLQASSVSPSATPNINGLGMAGVWVERVSAMPPDSSEHRLYTLLSGIELKQGERPDMKKTIMAALEKSGVKTALVDGSGKTGDLSGVVSIKNTGNVKNDRETMDAAMELIRTQKPYLTVVVLGGDRQQQAPADGQQGTIQAGAADNEVGRFLNQLHADGLYEDTALVVTGTTGKPPLIIKGREFMAGTKLPPVCLKDLAPTLGYICGASLPETKGLIMWNAILPGPGRNESYMLQQRVRELSNSYADANDSAARLESEKMAVQEEKAWLTGEKQMVEGEISEREKRINSLTLTISVLKAAILLILIIFAVALFVEYRVLKKKYLFFT